MATLVPIYSLEQSVATTQSGNVPLLARGFRVGVTIPATLTTALAGANNDLTYTARAAGTAGNAVTVNYTVAGANTPLTIGVAANAITVNVATNGGSAATSTAAQVRDAIRASAPAKALVLVDLAPGNDGTGVVAALGTTNLTGGVNQATQSGDRNDTNITPTKVFMVDVDNADVRKRLSRARQRWVVVPNGVPNNVAVYTLGTPSTADVGQSYVSRGWRIPNNIYGFVGTDVNQNVVGQNFQVVDLTNPTVRRALREHYNRVITGSTASTLVTIRGLKTSSGAPGGGISNGRGFRIPSQFTTGSGSGVNSLGQVTTTTNLQVDLANQNVRRALRRNFGSWIVVSAP